MPSPLLSMSSSSSGVFPSCEVAIPLVTMTCETRAEAERDVTTSSTAAAAVAAPPPRPTRLVRVEESHEAQAPRTTSIVVPLPSSFFYPTDTSCSSPRAFSSSPFHSSTPRPFTRPTRRTPPQLHTPHVQTSRRRRDREVRHPPVRTLSRTPRRSSPTGPPSPSSSSMVGAFPFSSASSPSSRLLSATERDIYRDYVYSKWEQYAQQGLSLLSEDRRGPSTPPPAPPLATETPHEGTAEVGSVGSSSSFSTSPLPISPSSSSPLPRWANPAVETKDASATPEVEYNPHWPWTHPAIGASLLTADAGWYRPLVVAAPVTSFPSTPRPAATEDCEEVDSHTEEEVLERSEPKGIRSGDVEYIGGGGGSGFPSLFTFMLSSPWWRPPPSPPPSSAASSFRSEDDGIPEEMASREEEGCFSTSSSSSSTSLPSAGDGGDEDHEVFPSSTLSPTPRTEVSNRRSLSRHGCVPLKPPPPSPSSKEESHKRRTPTKKKKCKERGVDSHHHHHSSPISSSSFSLPPLLLVSTATTRRRRRVTQEKNTIFVKPQPPREEEEEEEVIWWNTVSKDSMSSPLTDEALPSPPRTPVVHSSGGSATTMAMMDEIHTHRYVYPQTSRSTVACSHCCSSFPERRRVRVGMARPRKPYSSSSSVATSTAIFTEALAPVVAASGILPLAQIRTPSSSTPPAVWSMCSGMSPERMSGVWWRWSACTTQWMDQWWRETMQALSSMPSSDETHRWNAGSERTIPSPPIVRRRRSNSGGGGGVGHEEDNGQKEQKTTTACMERRRIHESMEERVYSTSWEPTSRHRSGIQPVLPPPPPSSSSLCSVAHHHEEGEEVEKEDPRLRSCFTALYTFRQVVLGYEQLCLASSSSSSSSSLWSASSPSRLLCSSPRGFRVLSAWQLWLQQCVVSLFTLGTQAPLCAPPSGPLWTASSSQTAGPSLVSKGEASSKTNHSQTMMAFGSSACTAPHDEAEEEEKSLHIMMHGLCGIPSHQKGPQAPPLHRTKHQGKEEAHHRKRRQGGSRWDGRRQRRSTDSSSSPAPRRKHQRKKYVSNGKEASVWKRSSPSSPPRPASASPSTCIKGSPSASCTTRATVELESEMSAEGRNVEDDPSLRALWRAVCEAEREEQQWRTTCEAALLHVVVPSASSMATGVAPSTICPTESLVDHHIIIETNDKEAETEKENDKEPEGQGSLHMESNTRRSSSPPAVEASGALVMEKKKTTATTRHSQCVPSPPSPRLLQLFLLREAFVIFTHHRAFDSLWWWDSTKETMDGKLNTYRTSSRSHQNPSSSTSSWWKDMERRREAAQQEEKEELVPPSRTSSPRCARAYSSPLSLQPSRMGDPSIVPSSSSSWRSPGRYMTAVVGQQHQAPPPPPSPHQEWSSVEEVGSINGVRLGGRYRVYSLSTAVATPVPHACSPLSCSLASASFSPERKDKGHDDDEEEPRRKRRGRRVPYEEDDHTPADTSSPLLSAPFSAILSHERRNPTGNTKTIASGGGETEKKEEKKEKAAVVSGQCPPSWPRASFVLPPPNPTSLVEEEEEEEEEEEKMSPLQHWNDTWWETSLFARQVHPALPGAWMRYLSLHSSPRFSSFSRNGIEKGPVTPLPPPPPPPPLPVVRSRSEGLYRDPAICRTALEAVEHVSHAVEYPRFLLYYYYYYQYHYRRQHPLWCVRSALQDILPGTSSLSSSLSPPASFSAGGPKRDASRSHGPLTLSSSSSFFSYSHRLQMFTVLDVQGEARVWRIGAATTQKKRVLPFSVEGRKTSAPEDENVTSMEHNPTAPHPLARLDVPPPQRVWNGTSPLSSVASSGVEWCRIPLSELNVGLGYLMQVVESLRSILFPLEEDLTEDDAMENHRTKEWKEKEKEKEEEGEGEGEEKEARRPSASFLLPSPPPHTLYWIRRRSQGHFLWSSSSSSSSFPSDLLSDSPMGEVLFFFHWARRWKRVQDRQKPSTQKRSVPSATSTTSKTSKTREPRHPTNEMTANTSSSSSTWIRWSPSMALFSKEELGLESYRIAFEPRGDKSTIACYAEVSASSSSTPSSTSSAFSSLFSTLFSSKPSPTASSSCATHPVSPGTTTTTLVHRLPFYIAPSLSSVWGGGKNNSFREACVVFTLVLRTMVHQLILAGQRELLHSGTLASKWQTSPPRAVVPPTNDEGRAREARKEKSTTVEQQTGIPITEKNRNENQNEEERGGGESRKHPQASCGPPTVSLASSPVPPFLRPPFEIGVDGSIGGLSIHCEEQTHEHHWTLAWRRLLMVVQWCVHTAMWIEKKKEKRKQKEEKRRWERRREGGGRGRSFP